MCLLLFHREEDGQWKEDQKLEAHSDWVRDVGWAPSIGLPTSTIASCSQVISAVLDVKSQSSQAKMYDVLENDSDD